MKKNGIFERIRSVFNEITGKNRIGKFDLGVLQTMMMLAAVDGDITDGEISGFREAASRCSGYNSESFDSLCEKTLRSAGYLLLLTRFLPREKIIDAFVREAEKPFTREVAVDTDENRANALDSLKRMAEADGVFSDIERDCVNALTQRVETLHELETAARISRATYFDPFAPNL
ncbi:MAG: TerB family tellurite resistance protein [Kiritimatiellae bacterium]|nr:TerB family tellurite resistance protein [Kiritimatiellia bacterium]